MTKLTGITKAILGLTVGGALVAALLTHREHLSALFGGGAQARPPNGPPVQVQRQPGQTVIGLCEWPGQMPFVLANGGLTTQPGSIVASEGMDLKIVFIDDPIKKNKALLEGAVDAVWSTVDEMPITMATYKTANVEVKAFMQLDWSRGGDACVASPEIKTVEDVLGKKSAMLLFSPEHTLFEFMIGNSRFTAPQIARVRSDASFSPDDPLFARRLFVDKKVDLACVWEPDVSLAISARPGAHKLFSTAEATELLTDVLLVRQDLMDSKPALLEKIARVWFAGMAKAEADLPAAARFISSTVPRFRDELGREQTLRAFDWVRFCDLTDNVNFFALNGGRPAFDRIYNQADHIWMEYPEAEIKDRFVPATLRDARIIRRIWDTAGRKLIARAEKFEPGTAQSGQPLFTKPLSVTFRGGSADLDTQAMDALNEQLLPQIEIAHGMYVRVEGNTDSVGAATINQKLSEQRAQAIVDYLVSRGVERTRILARGNGASRPIASNRSSEGRALNRRTDVLFIPARHPPS
jgi:outer membrane protein OmpA-like peptidoglycan-associated protein/ABC-type nitrate/sulfonate/bicarbonate transport system substrate-binding protein